MRKCFFIAAGTEGRHLRKRYSGFCRTVRRDQCFSGEYMMYPPEPDKRELNGTCRNRMNPARVIHNNAVGTLENDIVVKNCSRMNSFAHVMNCPAKRFICPNARDFECYSAKSQQFAIFASKSREVEK
jgi:hypothetical protein